MPSLARAGLKDMQQKSRGLAAIWDGRCLCFCPIPYFDRRPCVDVNERQVNCAMQSSWQRVALWYGIEEEFERGPEYK